ncbi:nebulin-related-anchoring protein isoform X1 [Spea bombifrons]|uniref:nebulin-related-anchoring protein isoform X1 n=1 Tax=Spea bombifrons TaxID=233779 RepID=UPI00234A0E27|nr:nebulin-related-anchoring protein isoform X1 [Spea bombifrons]
MNVVPCARCGYGVYPPEKINCIDQIWHKACFHCETCKMILTVNNFVSYQKRPYCQAHNPKNNTFTSVYETPVNIHVKKQSQAVSEIKYREEGEKYKSVFNWDLKSREFAHDGKMEKLINQNTYDVGKSWLSDVDPEMVRVTQTQNTLSDVSKCHSFMKYTENFEQQTRKGSFPALITPAYQTARKAGHLASSVEYKRGHEERVSQYTTVVDTKDILHARTGGQLASDAKYTEDYEERRGKGSFPAMITPGYQIAKKANELASDIKYHHRYETEIKGKASQTAATDVTSTKQKRDRYSQDYLEEDEEYRGKGSFPAMITPAYLNAKKANEMASDIKYKKDFTKMKGAAHYHSLTTEDNLTLKRAQNVNKLVSEVEYKKDLENTKGHSINYCETPQFRNASKVSKFTSDLKYKEKYQSQMKGHYDGVGMDRRTLHAMKAGSLASNVAYKSEYKHDDVNTDHYYYPATQTPSYQTTRKLVPLKDVNYRQSIDKLKYSSVTNTPEIVLAKANAQQLSNLNYRAEYEKTKTHYTLPQDVPEMMKAKANAELYSENKYKEGWVRNKGHGFEMHLDSLPILAAKASRNLASDIKYKEEYEKSKGRAAANSDSRLLHSLQVAKRDSEIHYKRGFEESKTHFHLPMDMVNLAHAKKAQALASDLDYRKRLHDYTILPEDMKVKWARKAYDLQSELQYKSDLSWMRGVGWVADRSLNVEQAKKAGDLISERKYRQKADMLKFTSVADSPQIKHAKKSQALQSDLVYKSGTERLLHHYTMSNDEPLFLQAKSNAANLSEKRYKSSWEKQKETGFELRLDALSILTAKAKRDLASDIKYKESYEKTKGKLIGARSVHGDSHISHSLKMSKMQSDLGYKREAETSMSRYRVSMDTLDMAHATMAQSLATDLGYRTFLHRYRALPSDMRVEWAKKAYNLQSDNLYRSDLKWMKGIGCITAGSLDVLQAKKAGQLISEKAYRQLPCDLTFTSIQDTPEMIQARRSYNQSVDSKYKAQGEDLKHRYTATAALPELLQAKLNAINISETRYKESWSKVRDGGYKLKLDAIPFQAAKASGEIISDHKYKEEFEKTKGKMIGLRRVEDDINIAHSVHASSLLSDVQYKKGFEKCKTQFHLPMDMVHLLHAKKAQSLVSDQEYRHLLHHYTSLTDDIRILSAKRAYELQSEKLYRSDLNFMRGVGCVVPGSLEIEEKKKASNLISERKYRQQPHSFKHTAVTDSLDILHAKFSNKITNERLYKAAGEETLHHYTTILGLPEHVRAKLNAANISDIKYRESWLNMRAQGHKLTMDALQFQSAKFSGSIASDYKYKHNYVSEKGKHIGARSILDDPKMLHCLRVAKLQSEQQYKKEFSHLRSHYHLPLDMVNLVHAKKAQALASDQDYKTRLHEYTAEPEDMKLLWARKAYQLQSESRYKSDLNFMRGVGWEAAGSPHLEGARKAGDLISETKYRQCPGSLAFTSVVDSPDLVHAKNSYRQCNERLYKLGDSESIHRCSLPPDHPDFIRARINASQISDKAYRTSWEASRAAGYDLRLDAIPFQTAKASREIASDFRYKEAFVKDKGHQIGFLSVRDDPKTMQAMMANKLQSDKEYKRLSAETRSKFKTHLDQPGFIQAKKSQQQASDVNYRQHLHQYTCDPQQLNLKHAKHSHSLQSDVKYKSDLNWMKGVGWTPPGYYNVELARRAAEMASAEEEDPQMTTGSDHSTRGLESAQRGGVNPDASEILQVKRKRVQPVPRRTPTQSMRPDTAGN